MERFVNVARVDEVRKGTGKLVSVEGLFVALLNSDGAFYGLENHCPLDGASLSDGLIAGSLVECPGDKAKFFLPTGECISRPEAKRVRSYRIRVDKEDIYVDLRHRTAWKKSEHEVAAGLQTGALMDWPSIPQAQWNVALFRFDGKTQNRGLLHPKGRDIVSCVLTR